MNTHRTVRHHQFLHMPLCSKTVGILFVALAAIATASLAAPQASNGDKDTTTRTVNAPAPPTTKADGSQNNAAKTNTAAEKPSYLILICRQETKGINIISSRTVDGKLKPRYVDNVDTHMAQMLDEHETPVAQAYYAVPDKIYWDSAESDDGSGKLVGGSFPITNPVFVVRVPYSSKAKVIRLAKLGNREDLLKAKKGTADFDTAKSKAIRESVELLRIDLGQLHSQQEVK